MRIGLTDYYSTKKHIYTRDPETNRVRPQIAPAYVLSLYNQPSEYAHDLVREMREFGIFGQYKHFIDDDLELPHILIILPESVKRLEDLFKQQGIELPENRFDKPTNWDHVLDFEKDRAKSIFPDTPPKKHKSVWQRVARCLGR